MPINDLFKANEQYGRPSVPARIGAAIERVRSHALGFGSCGCSTGALSAVGFAEFEAALIHHLTTTYPELSADSPRSIEDVVNTVVSLPIDKTEPILAGILAALMSYGDQCRAFRADELE